MDLEANSLFTRIRSCTLCSSELVTWRYEKISKAVLGFLLAFQNSGMVEAGLTHINAFLTKKRKRLDLGERGDLSLKRRHPQLNIHEFIINIKLVLNIYSSFHMLCLTLLFTLRLS